MESLFWVPSLCPRLPPYLSVTLAYAGASSGKLSLRAECDIQKRDARCSIRLAADTSSSKSREASGYTLLGSTLDAQ